jgi:hypothetical protein
MSANHIWNSENRLRATAPAVFFQWSGRASVRLLTPHCRFDTQRMLSKKTARMGDKARPSVDCRSSPAASLSEINPFVLAVTSRKIESKFHPRASDTKAMTRLPCGQGADFGLHSQGCRGLSFFYRAVL